MRAWIVACLVLTGSAMITGAQVADSDARIEEVTYSGDGNVTVSDAGLYLWRSGPHRFAAVISTNASIDGELCLLTAPTGSDNESELACKPATIAGITTQTIAISIDSWPAGLIGSQEVDIQLRGPNTSEPIARETLSVTVIRKDGDSDEDGLANGREASLGTGVFTPDTDGDGLSDAEEVRTYETSPLNNDTDGDGLSDPEEIEAHETNPTKIDTDEDGLSDSGEVNRETNPNEADSDGDGIDDGSEVNVHETDPANPDSDGDGLDDGAEIDEHGTNPLQSDTDGDGVSDNLEVNTYGTDPTKIDTDGDGLKDGAEVNEFQTDPTKADSDGDGLTDGTEVNTYQTNPTNPDTDSDGLKDGAEVNKHGTNPNRVDTDNDGRSDQAEVADAAFPLLPISALVLAGVVVVLVAAGGLLYRSGQERARPLGRWLRMASDRVTSSLGDGASPTDGTEGQSVEEIPPEFLSNEDRVLMLLDEHDGRMRQSAIVEETDWSKSKVSRVLSEMEEDEQIVKIDVGEGNLVTRPDDLPPGFRSPLEDR